MTIEEARVDAILAASEADKDSFAEIVTLINSVDTENDEAFAAYVLSNNAALSTEVARAGSEEAAIKAAFAAADSTEKARAEAAEAALQADIDQNEADADAAISSEIARAESAEASLGAAFAAADSTEKARALAAEAALQADIDQNEADADAAVASLATAFAAADTALSSSFGSRMTIEEARVDAILAASEADKDSFAEIVTLINSVDTENDEAFAAYVLSNNAALSTEVARAGSEEAAIKAAFAAADSTEKARAEAAEAALQADIDQNEADADEAISSEISRAESAEASIDKAMKAADSTEKARAEAAEASLATALAAEASTRLAADDKLDERVDNIISNTDIASIDSFTEVQLTVDGAIQSTAQQFVQKRVSFLEALDGIQVEFTLSDTLIANTDQVFLNGVLQDSASDYSISGNTLTMVAAPAATDKLTVMGTCGSIFKMDGTSTSTTQRKGK